MGDTYDDYDDDEYGTDDNDSQEQRTSQKWAALRRAKKEAKKAQQEAAEAKKAMAFLKAGIDPDSPKAKYFVKGYEGEITAEAIRAEAIAAGVIEEQQQTVDQTPVDTQARIAEAASGVGEGDMELAVAALDQAFAQGGTEGMLEHLAGLGVPINGSIRE